MAKSISWRTVSTYSHKRATSPSRDTAGDKWQVDRFPTAKTKSVKVSYGDLKVVKRYGKK